MRNESFLKMFGQIVGMGSFWLFGMVLPSLSFVFLGKSLNYHEHTTFFVCYFLILVILTFLLFPQTARKVDLNKHLKNYILLPIVLALAAFCYGFYFNYLDPNGSAASILGVSKRVNFIYNDLNFFIVKSIEIAFQQTLIVGLILSLASHYKKLRYIILWYAGIFGLAHVFLLFIFPPFLTAIFFTFSILSAILFPILILKTKSGFVYTYVVHWLFYIFLSLFMILTTIY